MKIAFVIMLKHEAVVDICAALGEYVFMRKTIDIETCLLR